MIKSALEEELAANGDDVRERVFVVVMMRVKTKMVLSDVRAVLTVMVSEYAADGVGVKERADVERMRINSNN